MSYTAVAMQIPTSPSPAMRRSCLDNYVYYSSRVTASSTKPELKLSRSLTPKAVRSFLFDTETSNDTETLEGKDNWMESLMEISSLWWDRVAEGDEEEEDGCQVCYDSEDEEETRERENRSYDRESFSKHLSQVPFWETKLYSKLAFLCNMAYNIPQIKAYDLKGHYGLEFVTSSLERKAEAKAVKQIVEQDSIGVPTEIKHSVHQYNAYEIAASYVQSRAKEFLSLGSQSLQNGSFTITTASDLQSLHSSPCEWFICDDTSTYTRCFVIQGSDSLAAWQANLFFGPTQFEGMDALVHRGIYEAAKGMYQQLLPEIKHHLIRYGDRAKFQFTGHSLGGSLALLVHLMLVARKVVEPCTLRPTVTFGSPFVFSGGHKMLRELGLDESHVHCVMMHRDIIPRAFSCTYPHHVALFLKNIESFKSHPCFTNNLLYSPMGKMLILQPDEKSAPPHPLLPPGIAMYALDESPETALHEFMNNPHPLNTFSDPAAYGWEGTILRDHHSNNYMKSIRGIVRRHKKRVVVRKQRNLTRALLCSLSPRSWSRDKTLVDSTKLFTNKNLLVHVAS